MEWTREKTLLLISEYKKRRGLWDMTHDDYRKKEVKQKLLTEVSCSLGGGIPTLEVEKKFHTLRTQYHREINRMKRKEPYNSKWFGFKNLEFLSSPKACRSNKGRVRSEITEEGTVTTKFVIEDPTSVQNDASGVVNGGASASTCNNNGSEEFVTIPIRRRHNIVYDSVNGRTNYGSRNTASSRSHELEKLIEETTKDVEDIEDPKPKMSTKELEHDAYSSRTQVHSIAGSEISTSEQQQEDQHHNHQQVQQLQQIDDEAIQSIDMQATEDDGSVYQPGDNRNASVSPNTVMAPRIIKIQRRMASHDDVSYYDEGDNNAAESATVHHSSYLSGSGSTKRIYYDSTGHTTLVATPTAAPLSNSTIIASSGIKIHQTSQNRASMSQQSSPQPRDEFATYGEYVGNEMRGIMNREILTALKHKINTALFEANMAELQK